MGVYVSILQVMVMFHFIGSGKEIKQAIREYVESHSRAELLDRVLDDELPRYAEALERLGQ